jgi:hypothetical protein
VADLTEEFSILTNKYQLAVQEKESYQSKLKEGINRMSQLRDQLQDKDEKVE